MLKFGFEKEYFIKRRGEFVLAPTDLPRDDCGWLVEARGEPHGDARSAAFLLLAEEERLHSLARARRLTLVDTSVVELPRDLIRQAIRQGGKPVTIGRYNMYTNYAFDPDDGKCRAGLHIHFSNLVELRDNQQTLRLIPGLLNMPKWISALDAAFEKEIAAAERVKGEYEIKHYGFEYRSLPANVSLRKVVEALENIRITGVV